MAKYHPSHRVASVARELLGRVADPRATHWAAQRFAGMPGCRRPLQFAIFERIQLSLSLLGYWYQGRRMR